MSDLLQIREWLNEDKEHAREAEQISAALGGYSYENEYVQAMAATYWIAVMMVP